MRKLFLIPARGGSKGLPGKNIMLLGGRPMIEYSLDVALDLIQHGDQLCVSTDDPEIASIVKDYGVDVPFIRPDYLSTDLADSDSVIRHAVNWYQNEMHCSFDVIVLLQVTSPLRLKESVSLAISLWNPNVDMVVGVKRAKANPYYSLYELNGKGYLVKSKEGNYKRRQDCPEVFEFNGAVYVISVKALNNSSLSAMSKVLPILMSDEESIDIDTKLDYEFAEFIFNKRKTDLKD